MGDGTSPLFYVSRTKRGEGSYSSQHNPLSQKKQSSVKTISVFAGGKNDNITKFQN
jgi:hypothetical protein